MMGKIKGQDQALDPFFNLLFDSFEKDFDYFRATSHGYEIHIQKAKGSTFKGIHGNGKRGRPIGSKDKKPRKRKSE